MHDGITLRIKTKIKDSMLCVTGVYLKDIIDRTNTFFPVLLLNVSYEHFTPLVLGLKCLGFTESCFFLLFYSFTATVGGFVTILGQ